MNKKDSVLECSVSPSFFALTTLMNTVPAVSVPSSLDALSSHLSTSSFASRRLRLHHASLSADSNPRVSEVDGNRLTT